ADLDLVRVAIGVEVDRPVLVAEGAPELGRVVLPDLPPPVVDPVADVEAGAGVGAGVRPLGGDLARERVGQRDRTDLDHSVHASMARAVELAVVAETTRNLRTPVTFLASTCLLQLHRDRSFWSTTPTTPRFKLGKSHGGRDRGCPAGGRARKPGRLVARHRTRPSAPRLR